MGPARKTNRVSRDDEQADRAEHSKTISRREPAKPANDDSNVLRQARRMRDEWRRNRYARLKPA